MAGCLLLNARVEADWRLYLCFLTVTPEAGLKRCSECRERKGYENAALVAVGGIRNLTVLGRVCLLWLLRMLEDKVELASGYLWIGCQEMGVSSLGCGFADSWNFL